MPTLKFPARIGACLLVVSVITAVMPLPVLSAQAATLQTVMRDTILENGLQVVVVPNPTVPLVTIQVTIRNGAFTQLTPADAGVPHLLEHMLFRSFGRNGFAEPANRINAAYNGTTSDETVTYYLTLPSENLDRGVELLADLMRAPRFQREALTSEQQVVRGELERAVSNPNFLLGLVVDQVLWGDAQQRKSPSGNVPAVLAATPERLTETYQRFYVPNNAAVVFSGDVGAAEAFASSAKHFAQWRRAPDPFADLEFPAIPFLESNQAVIAELDASDITFLVRWQGPSVTGDPESTIAADLFAAIVNDPVSGFQERLVDSGLFQSVSMSYLTRAHIGPVSIFATTTADQFTEASAALLEEIGKFADPGYVTPELLSIAKKRQEVNWAIAMETPTGLASFVGELWSVADLDYARDYVDALQAQEIADLERYVAIYLAYEPRVMGSMISPAIQEALGEDLLMSALTPWAK